jgi:radical SAM protein with 4Fe4S-binding SPASM domain
MLTRPLSLHLEITEVCNNACAHCYAGNWIDMPGKKSQPRSKRAKPSIVDVAQRVAECDPFEVTITGGEPLVVRSDRLKDVFARFSEHNIQYSLNTNGRLLREGTCKELKEAGLASVLVSLHSWDDALHNEIVGSRKAASETKIGIRNALNSGLRVAVNQVIDSRNISTMYSSALELERMGVHQICLTRALSPLEVGYEVGSISAGRFLDEFIKCREDLSVPVKSLLPIPFCADDRVRDLGLEMSCSGGFSSAVVSCFGDVRFCPHDSYVWGNIFEDDIAAIWKKITQWRSETFAPDKCRNCSFIADCGGGCRVASKLQCENDDYSAMDPWAHGPTSDYRRKIIEREFDAHVEYRLRPDMRWRKEGDSYVLFYEGRHSVLNWDGIDFIQNLPNQFVPSTLLQSATSDVPRLFFQLLYHNGIILKSSTSAQTPRQ